MIGDVVMTEDQAIDLQMSGRDEGKLVLWTIYEDTTDYPGRAAARAFLIGQDNRSPEGSKRVLLSNRLDDLRDIFIGFGLTRLDRDPADDPAIVESWL